VRISGRRVIIGEYGWGGSLSSAAQEPKTRAYIQRLLSWGPRFILFWEMYNNEPNKAYWLIDSNNVKAPCYFLHQRFIAQAKLQAARFWETNGRLPDDAEFNSLLKPSLNFPLYDPARLTVSNRDLTAVSVEAATVEGSVLQGKYGDDCARVFVFWGTGDGGTNRESWDNSQFLGVNTQFNTAVFSAALTNLNARTNYFFRFCATNSSGATWAPASSSFSTDVLRPEDFGYRLRVAFRGYDRGSTLTQFPALVILGPDVPGFSYSQFASRTGGDLRFTDPTGTREIPFELDEWNLDGNSYVWVNLPSLSSTNDFIYAYWGNPLATNAPVTATNGLVWSPNGEIIWHLKEVGLPLRDSAAKHSSVAGDPPARADGRVGHAGSFNGVTDGVSPGTIDLGDRFTLSAWVKMDPSANSIQTIWANKQGGSETAGLAFFINSYNSVDGKLILETGNGTLGSVAVTETSAVGAGVWHHVAAAVDRVAGSADLYVDGMNRTLLASARNDFTNQAPLYFGRFAGASAFWFKGAIDEARIEKEARSSDWVWATWMNVASNSVFQASEGVKNQAFAIRPSLLGDGGWSLAWGAAGVGWRLYSTTNLARNDSWIAAPETPVLANNQWQVTLTVERQSPQFFRLQAP